MGRRISEAKMNNFPHFITEIEGLKIHFMALFSQKKDAVPIVFLHGWPGNQITLLLVVMTCD